MGWGRGLGHSRRHRPQEADLTPTSVPPKAPAAGVSQPGRGRGGRSPDKRARAEVRVLQRVGLLLRGHRLPLASRGWRGTGTRCSWRPGHLTGPLGESSRTACFLERSAGCPPGGQLNRLSGVVSGQRLNASAATAAGSQAGAWLREEGKAGRNLRGTTGRCETRSQSSLWRRVSEMQAGPAPGCKLYGRARSKPRHPPRCREGAAESVYLCCSEPPPGFWKDPEKAGQRH